MRKYTLIVWGAFLKVKEERRKGHCKRVYGTRSTWCLCSGDETNRPPVVP
jgi:hypothetical protein